MALRIVQAQKTEATSCPCSKAAGTISYHARNQLRSSSLNGKDTSSHETGTLSLVGKDYVVAKKQILYTFLCRAKCTIDFREAATSAGGRYVILSAASTALSIYHFRLTSLRNLGIESVGSVGLGRTPFEISIIYIHFSPPYSRTCPGVTRKNLRAKNHPRESSTSPTVAR